MREEQPGEGSRPSHMASQPSSSVHTGPSARREETNKVRRWPVGLKAFLDRVSVSKPVPAALCVILTGLLGSRTYRSRVKNTLSDFTDWIGAREDGAATVAVRQLYAINQHIITQPQHLITL